MSECTDTLSPHLSVAAITFSNGKTITLEPTDTVVFVGPNNSGKTQALRDIETQLHSGTSGTTLSAVHFSRNADTIQVEKFIRDHSRITLNSSGQEVASGLNYKLTLTDIAGIWEHTHHLRELAGALLYFARTDNRLGPTEPVTSYDPINEPPSDPVHLIFDREDLANAVNSYFIDAFGEELSVYHRGAARIPLMVGERPSLLPNEDRVSESFAKRLASSTVQLEKQGDGMRSFATILLHLLIPTTPSILLLDEPEAFLHPPQAKLAGKLIASNRRPATQLFVATHSPHVLDGIFDSVDDSRLRIIRLDREGDRNIPHELEPSDADFLRSDPILKHSLAIEGVFHKRVIVCEGDTDCLFYRALLDLEDVHGDITPDVLFLSAGSKQRLHRVAAAMTALGVPVDVIGDLDLLENATDLRNVWESVGGTWSDVDTDVRVVRSAIENASPRTSTKTLATDIRNALDAIDATVSPDEFRAQIREITKAPSAWSGIKKGGESNIPSGDASVSYTRLMRTFRERGIWLVPVGELERFCPLVGGHGPKWFSEVLDSYDLGMALELHKARQFVCGIWHRDVEGIA